MRVRFWGTRGSIAKAGPDTVRYGGNTSCVELVSAAGTTVVLDCGTGAHGLGHALRREGRARRGHVLISHTHWDHIQGLPFFAPLFEAGNRWDLYGPQGLGSSLQDVLAGQMEYTYFPITPDQFGAEVGYHDLREGVFQLGDIRVTAHYLNHPALTLGYRFEVDGRSVVYCTDHEPHDHRLACGGAPEEGSADEAHGRFMADADLVIHDAQYTAAEYPEHRGWGHSTVEYVSDLACRAGVRRLALFHHDPHRSDDAVDRLLESARERVASRPARPEISGAAEGSQVELAVEPRTSRSVVPVRRPVPTPEGAPAPRVVVRMQPGVLMDTVLGAAEADGLPVRLCGPDDAADEDELLVTDREGAEGNALVLREPVSLPMVQTRIRAALMQRPVRWHAAPLRPDEAERQRVVDSLHLSRREEERFDRHARIARALFGVKNASFNVLDGDLQWCKATTLSHTQDLPRDISICAHALTRPELVFQITDARRDGLFADHPDVSDGPLRFYAGAAVVVRGQPIGTLCVTDDRPRRLSEEQEALLQDLASLVAQEF